MYLNMKSPSFPRAMQQTCRLPIVAVHPDYKDISRRAGSPILVAAGKMCAMSFLVRRLDLVFAICIFS